MNSEEKLSARAIQSALLEGALRSWVKKSCATTSTYARQDYLTLTAMAVSLLTVFG